jgi:kynurenine formamidase
LKNKLIDLTQTITHHLQVYPGDTAPELFQSHSIQKNNFTNYHLSTEMHVGTHIDGTMHLIESNQFISQIPLQSFIGKACIIDISHYKVFNEKDLLIERVKDCSIILFYTGFGKKYGSADYFTNYPILDISIAKTIAEMKISMIGIDSCSPDMAPYDVHKKLLANNVLIAENLCNLDLLLAYKTFDVIALPLKIEADSAPARVVAVVD